MNYKTIILLALVNISGAFSQTLPPNFTNINLSTDDNVSISAVYKKPSTINDATIVLIHQGGSDKTEWIGTSSTENTSLIQKFFNNGYGILAYDIRMHGSSGTDLPVTNDNFVDLFSNPNRSPLDLLAAIEFLKNDSNVNQNKIGILGASIGGNLACVAAGNKTKYNTNSSISISSKTAAVKDLGGYNSNKDITIENTFHISSEGDQNGKRKDWANQLFNMTNEEKKVSIVSGDKHGVPIIQEHPNLENDIIDWFNLTLKNNSSLSTIPIDNNNSLSYHLNNELNRLEITFSDQVNVRKIKTNIIEMNGQEIDHNIHFINNNSFYFDTSSFSKGIYILSIKSNEKLVNFKLSI